MTVLDTFYLLFKTDAPGAKSDVSALDKQLDELAKKGKKRSEDENRQYKDLQKQRKEQLDQIKAQRLETDKLADSFQNIATSIVGAAAAYTSFGFLKNGLTDANKLNASLAVLRDTYHLNAQELKGYASALDQAGGNGQDFVNFVVTQAQNSQQNRQPILQPGQWIERLRQIYRGPFGETNISKLGALPLVELLNKSPEEFERLKGSGFASGRLSNSDADAALNNQGVFAKTRAAFGSIATEVDTHLLGTIKTLNNALQGLANAFQGHPVAAEVAGTAAAVGTTLGGLTLWKVLTRLLGGGAGAAGAARFGGIGVAAAGIGSAAWYLLGKEQDFINNAFGKKSGGSARDRISSFWQSQGYSSGSAAGWTANAQAESSFNPLATNGSHFGIYQWNRDRRAKILAGTNIDVATAGLDEQLKAAAWEAGQMGLTPDRIPNDPRGAAGLISNRFEVPSLTASGLASEASRRGDIAAGYGVIPSAGSLGGGRNINVKTGDITIQTQATDARGIAGEVGAELKNQIRLAMSNFDDGVNY